MNTPSKEALNAARDVRCKIQHPFGWQPIEDPEMAAIIDCHFEPLRRDNAALAGRLTAAELERDGLGARAEQAEALLRETEAVAAQGATQYVELNRKFAELPALRARVAELAGALREMLKNAERDGDTRLAVQKALSVLARHAAGEPEAQK